MHSDQGSQFTSYEWQEFLEQHNLAPSMSRRGNCWDNAVVESFFNLLKRERIRRKKYKTREEVLNSLGFPMRAQRTQGYIWNEVVQQAKLQGGISIHFDECQHIFTATGKTTNDKVLDGFKALSKGKSRHSPFALILSEVPVLASYVNPYTQLKELLNPVQFDMIGGHNDIKEMNSLCFA